jgi:pyruvate-ferredoxin/flavodoxin oxidoreductase
MPVYAKPGDMPRLYSGCYGLGSRDMQPEAVVAAVENMLEKGAHKKFFYLSIDFVREKAANPKQEIHQQEILAAYPKDQGTGPARFRQPQSHAQGRHRRAHALRGRLGRGDHRQEPGHDPVRAAGLGHQGQSQVRFGEEGPAHHLLPVRRARAHPGQLRVHPRGRGAVPRPQRVLHTNAVAGLSKGGVFIIQSNLPAAVLWATLPMHIQKTIVDNDIRVFYLDAFSIAREESSNPDLQLRMQGNAFQGAFFHASDVQQRAGLDEETLFKAIENQLEDKFGKKGKRVVEDNLRVVKRGYTRDPRDPRRGEAGRRAPARRRQGRRPCPSCSSAAGMGKLAAPPTSTVSGSRPAISTSPARAPTTWPIRSWAWP